MAYLYQEILNVPGLTGTWQQRNAQLYKALGSPLGTYKGTYDQNIYLLNQLKKNNYFKSGLPGQQKKTTTTQSTTPVEQTLAYQYTNPLTQQVQQAAEIPQFQTMLSPEQAWQSILPGAQDAAVSQIRPEVMRDYKQANYDYLNSMGSAGGQRLGRGLAGLGNLKAESSRNYNALLQDWLGQQRGGFEELWYNPQRDIWNQGRTQATAGQTYEAPELPTWNDYYEKYGQAYNTGAPTLFS